MRKIDMFCESCGKGFEEWQTTDATMPVILFDTSAGLGRRRNLAIGECCLKAGSELLKDAGQT